MNFNPALVAGSVNDPQINSILRLLIPLGKTLAIVPLETKSTEKEVTG